MIQKDVDAVNLASGEGTAEVLSPGGAGHAVELASLIHPAVRNVIEETAKTYDLSTMRIAGVIGIIYNPASGYGKSERAALRAEATLKEQGCQVTLFKTKPSYGEGELQECFRPLSKLLIAGGDGTVMKLLPHLSAAGVPFYVLPTGTESLFAKKNGMSHDAGQLLAAVKSDVLVKHNYATVKLDGAGDAVPFLLMASVGLDSEVIANIAHRRTGPIRHWGYVLPTLRCALKHDVPAVTLKVDGKEVISAKTGFLIIANGSEYARNIGLVPEADTGKPSLCARFFPGGGVGFWLGLALKAAVGGRADVSGSAFFEGDTLELKLDRSQPYPLQADGELVGFVKPLDKVVFSAHAGEITVLGGKA